MKANEKKINKQRKNRKNKREKISIEGGEEKTAAIDAWSSN